MALRTKNPIEDSGSSVGTELATDWASYFGYGAVAGSALLAAWTFARAGNKRLRRIVFGMDSDDAWEGW